MNSIKRAEKTALFVFTLLLILILAGVGYSGYVSRVTTWSSSQTLTAAALNAEFDNVLDNGVGISTSQTLTNKTLTTPTLTVPVIADFSSATHDHSNVINGGNIENATAEKFTINTSVSGTAIQDDNTFSNATSNKIASSESIKAYVDSSAGKILQRVFVGYTGIGTTANNIPLDNTIPQNSEGKQFMSLSITPTDASNIILVNVQLLAGGNNSNTAVSSLFLDSEVDSRQATSSTVPTAANWVTIMNYSYRMVAGTTSSITFKINAGLANAGILTFNGLGGGSYVFGDLPTSSIEIYELRP